MDTAPETRDEVLDSLRAMKEAVCLLVQDNRELKEMLKLLLQQRTVKEWYTTSEAAQLLDRSEFTVREWCRNLRITAQKKKTGRGAHAAWTISGEEVRRIEREGILPLRSGGKEGRKLSASSFRNGKD